MKRDFLKKLGLEEEVIDKIMTENGKDVQAEQAKAEEARTEANGYKEQLEEANKTIESYKEMDIEQIKQSAEDYKEKYQQSVKDMENYKKDTALTRALQDTGAVDTDVVKLLIDKDTLKFKEDNIDGLDDQLKSLKESKSYLFTQEEEPEQEEESNFEAYTPPSGGKNPSEGSVWDQINAKYQN